MSNASTLIYPSGMMTRENYHINLYGENLFDYRKFEFNGSISASLNMNSIEVDDSDILYAYSNGEIRGKASPEIFPLTDELVFTLMTYSNNENEVLSFELYDNETDTYYAIDETVNFTKDMIIGDAENTITFNEMDFNPSEYELLPAYPNPFNPSTNINYVLPSAQNIRLSVYNIIGREVDVIEDGYRNEGNHSIVWDASNLASGIYYIKIAAGSFVETQKVMLIK